MLARAGGGNALAVAEDAVEERDLFDERTEPRTHTLVCSKCGVAGDYQLNWLVRRKKKQLNGRADDRDRARFAKAQSYMVLRDDTANCTNMRCRKRFEITGIKTMAFLD